MGNVRFDTRLVQQLLDLSRRVLQRQGEVIFGMLAELVDLLQILFDAHDQNVFDLSVREALGERDQVNRSYQALDVPGERADVALVEIVHVEIQYAAVIQIGAEVLRVQISLKQNRRR